MKKFQVLLVVVVGRGAAGWKTENGKTRHTSHSSRLNILAKE
jgi:hypothetical protein